MGLLVQGTVEQVVSTIETLHNSATEMPNFWTIQCHFTKLAWLTRNLSLFHKNCNGNSLIIIVPYYVNYGKSSHGHYNTRTSRKNDPITPKCKKSSGPRTFNSSVTGLWNGTET